MSGDRESSKVPARVLSALGELRARLTTRFGDRLAEFRLFGSYARGTFGPDSDVDVLVAIAGLTHRERHEVFDSAEEVFFTSLVRLAPLALSTEELATLRAREYRIAGDIEREGIDL